MDYKIGCAGGGKMVSHIVNGLYKEGRHERKDYSYRAQHGQAVNDANKI